MYAMGQDVFGEGDIGRRLTSQAAAQKQEREKKATYTLLGAQPKPFDCALQEGGEMRSRELAAEKMI